MREGERASAAPGTRKGGNTNELGDARAGPGRRSLLLLTAMHLGIGLPGEEVELAGRAPHSVRDCMCPVRPRWPMKSRGSVSVFLYLFAPSRTDHRIRSPR